MFEAKRFAEELSEEESSKRIKNAVPKSTWYKTQWGVCMFETFKRERSNDNAKDEQNTIGLEVSNVESLKTDMLRMSAETLNFWLCKFVQKVRLKLRRQSKFL